MNTQIKEIYRKDCQGENVAWTELAAVVATTSSVILDGAALYNEAKIRQSERNLINNPDDKNLKENLVYYKGMQKLSECLSSASTFVQVCCREEEVCLNDASIDSVSRLVHVWASTERPSNDFKTKKIKECIACTTAIANFASEYNNWRTDLPRNTGVAASPASVTPVSFTSTRNPGVTANSSSVGLSEFFYLRHTIVDVKAILEAIYGDDVPEELLEFQDPINYSFIKFPVRLGSKEIIYDKDSVIKWIRQNKGRARAPFGEANEVTERTLMPAFDIFGKMQKKCLDILMQKAKENELPMSLFSNYSSIIRRLKQGIKECFNLQVIQLQQARVKGILKSEDFRLYVQQLREDFGLEEASEKEIKK